MLLVACAISQSENANKDLHCFTDTEVVAIEAEIAELREFNTINEKLLGSYKIQISNYQSKGTQDSTLISLKNQEIVVLEESVEQYKELNKLMKPKWYDNKWLYYFYGALTIYTSASVASTIGE
tara:strand:+ start:1782 stop:2153 length:372 start_codon:yes stop_codon:yes gene_type:complete